MTLGTDTVSFVGKLHSKLQIDCTYTHKPGDKHFLTEVVMKNIAAERLYDVRYHRSFGPDNTVDAGGSYTTNNKIVSTRVSGDALTVVAATSPAGDAFASAVGKRSTIFFSIADDRMSTRSRIPPQRLLQRLRPRGTRIQETRPSKSLLG